ncbi:hypothetical protein [Niveibacterium terrae]|uniref:hypothetical protein n=1 Tax=Niveibacterium terrae TaxID=3373598 RepID=UPI003A8DA653
MAEPSRRSIAHIAPTEHEQIAFTVELAEIRERVPALMAGVAKLKVRLIAEVGHGANWDAAH